MNHAATSARHGPASAAGVAFFFKQSSAMRPGKGDVLDGVTYKEFPR